MSITRHQWLGKTTKRVLIKSWRPIKLPQNAFIVLMIYEKNPTMIDTTCISSMQRSNVYIQVHNIDFFPQGWLTERLSQRHYHDYTYITNWAAQCIFKFDWTNPTISKVKNINLHEISVNIIRGVIFVIKNPILHGLNNSWPLKWSIITKDIMTSSNRYISVLLALCVGSTGHRWITLSKVSDAELWYFLWSAPGIRNVLFDIMLVT